MSDSVATAESRELPGDRLTLFERGVALAAFLSMVGVWGTAFALDPDPRGIGTHEQLGLAECRMITLFGIPCAFCGMTTSFAHLAHGAFWTAIVTQPAGVFLAVLTAPAGGLALICAVRGLRPSHLAGWVFSKGALATGSAIVFLAWIYKVIMFL